MGTNKFIEYVNRFKKITTDATYKVKKESIIIDSEDPINENDKKIIENKLSKEKMKNIELKDKIKFASLKQGELEGLLEKKEKQISDLNKQVSSLMKENLTTTEKLRKGKNKESIPFKQIDELQTLKSNLSKLEFACDEKDKSISKLNQELSDFKKKLAKLQEDHDQLNDI